MSVTRAEIEAALQIVAAVGQAIQELGTVPSGHLYARLMNSLTYDRYTAVIETLKRAGVVREEPSHMLVWVGPPKAT